MGKNKRKKTGFWDKLLGSWKKQQVTLTRTGKTQPPAKKARTTRKTTRPAPPAGLSPRQRQAREIQTLVRIGRQDPERLAAIISRMLHEIREEDDKARLHFEQLVWEKADKKQDE